MFTLVFLITVFPSLKLSGFDAYFFGFEFTPLHATDQGFQTLSERMQVLSQETGLIVLKPLWQAAQNLMGRASGRYSLLAGQVLAEGEMELIKSSLPWLYRFCYYPKALLLYLFGDYIGACELLSQFRRTTSKFDFNPAMDSMTLLLEGLCLVAIARKNHQRHSYRAKLFSLKLRRLANEEPQGYLSKHVILEAELGGLARKNRKSILPKYFIAISVAKEGGSMLLYALANELTGKYLLNQRKQIARAEKYIQEALSTYSKWGAVAKVQFLQYETRQQLRV
jgi:hypothetical protein